MADEEPQGNLAGWIRIQTYRDRAAENLKLAETALAPDVRERYLKIAQHYLELADAQERSAKQGDSSPDKR
jgi:hypothetical protein